MSLNVQSPSFAPPRTAGGPYDAIVVGARVAGASTAMLLARQGLRVLLVERAPGPGTDTLSTHALMRAGVLQLDRWGLLDRLRQAGTPPIRRTTIHYGDEVQVVDIKERAGIDALYGPRRTVLDPLLVEAARHSGVDVRFGVAVRTLLWRGERVVGIVAEEGVRSWHAHAPWVIGADGLHSLVARQVGAAVSWRGAASGAFLYAYWKGLPQDGYRWFYRPGATAGIIPTNDGAACVWVGAPTHRFLDHLRHDLEGSYLQLLHEAAPEAIPLLERGRRVAGLRAFPGTPGFLRQAAGPGWALVGDAAAFRDPISAHGITDALRDAELLARAVAEAGRRGAGEPDLLLDYQRQRDDVARELAVITDEIASYRWNLTQVQLLLRSLAKAMGRELELLESLTPLQTAA